MEDKCPHQFFKVRKIEFTPFPKQEYPIVQEPTRYGVLVMCAMCGERRVLWEDGEIVYLPIAVE